MKELNDEQRKEFEKLEILRHEYWKEFENIHWKKGKVFKIQDIVNTEFCKMISKYNLSYDEIVSETFINQYFYFSHYGLPKGYTQKSWDDYMDQAYIQLRTFIRPKLKDDPDADITEIWI